MFGGERGVVRLDSGGVRARSTPPRRGFARLASIRPLDDRGRGLPSVLDHLLGTQRDLFDAVERDLHEAIPHVLTIVHSPDSPSLILIEEPENGVHPRQLERIVRLLQSLTDEATRGENVAQVVLATHSPYLDFVPASAVRVFGRKENGETVVAPLESLPGVKDLGVAAYDAVAEHVDLSLLERRCTLGFGRFVEELRARRK